MTRKNKKPEISIILPCRNEEQALPVCLKQIKNVIKQYKLSAEIIVSDSSTDKSPQIAKKEKVILLKHDKEGYGNAYLEAFKIVRGEYIFMADADCTYDFHEIPTFIEELKRGSDLIIGNRFAKKIDPQAMPFLKRYIGNPTLSLLFRLFFNAKIKDTQSGMRAITKKALNNLNLQTTGMEFASEMLIKAVRNKLKIKELPIHYYPRIGYSKLKPLPDGWKHIRFMLLYSPNFLFFIPGLTMFLLGVLSMICFYFISFQILGIKLSYQTMFFSSVLIIIGYQLINFAAFAKIYSINHLNEENKKLEKMFKYVTLEKALFVGVLMLLIGTIISFLVLVKWMKNGFESFAELKNLIIGFTFLLLGMQTVFSSFMLSILSIKK